MIKITRINYLPIQPAVPFAYPYIGCCQCKDVAIITSPGEGIWLRFKRNNYSEISGRKTDVNESLHAQVKSISLKNTDVTTFPRLMASSSGRVILAIKGESDTLEGVILDSPNNSGFGCYSFNWARYSFKPFNETFTLVNS